VLFALALMVSACKGGLYTDKGNDFPCDFSQPEGQRDAVCSPGEVCGVDNLCRQYRYEGPQFDNGATAPHFDEPLFKHPGVLDHQVSAVTRRFFGNQVKMLVVMGTGLDGSVVGVDYDQTATASQTVPYPGDVSQLTSLAMPHGVLSPWVTALVRVGNDDVTVFYDSTDLSTPRVLAIDAGVRLSSAINGVTVLRFEPDGGASAVAVSKNTTGPTVLPLETAVFFPDGGPIRALDVQSLPKLAPLDLEEVLILTRDTLAFKRGLQPPVQLTSESMTDMLTKPTPAVSLRRDPFTGTIAAFAAGLKVPVVLSSWRIDRGNTPSAQRLWNDCTPCNGGHIAAFAPSFDDGAPAVEVLCTVPVSASEEAKGGLKLVRVVGSATANDSQLCTIEGVDAPFALAEMTRIRRGRKAVELDGGDIVSDDSNGFGVLLGGVHGQVWFGPSFSSALPLFLDRVPVAFGAFPTGDGGLVEAVFTDRYAALPRVSGMGFQTFDLLSSNLQLPKGAVGAAFVGQARGWGVLSSADLVLLTPPSADAGLLLSFGPRLVDARGAPARGPFFAEAAIGPDGGVISFVVAADDSVYFTPAPSSTTETADVLDEVGPQLTPAPSSPIRSFTLERSPVGTNGVDKVRAYLIAGRSLFLVTLDGTPPRWSATPLIIQGGEPIEVWMDHPLGGLGRVGYRDGQVFTLPGGFLLVNELPRDAGNEAPQVFDYESLGGWPVAMTSNGLFEAHYEVLDGGRLVNRFEDGGINRPMDWRRVTLPDGGEPWLGQPGVRLNVRQDTEPFDPSTGVNPGPTGPPPLVKIFHLQVYTSQQVIEVGTLIRK
jgi:hypothetical protein